MSFNKIGQKTLKISEKTMGNVKPRFCHTATGYLIVEDGESSKESGRKGEGDLKILLVKHKKLGVWIMPGGHIDPGEMPHQAAEREFWEETGVKVRAVLSRADQETNEELAKRYGEDSGNEELRQKLVGLSGEFGLGEGDVNGKESGGEDLAQELKLESVILPTPFRTVIAWISIENYERRLRGEKPLAQWKRGCEKHFDFGYLVEPIDGVEYRQNMEETDGIAWFGEEEIEGLETFDDVRIGIGLAFEAVRKLKK